MTKIIKSGLEDIVVEYIDMSEANMSEEKRIEAVTSLAAISRGKSASKNPAVRYNKLLVEAEGNKPSRPLEFLPVRLSKKQVDGCPNPHNLKRFSHRVGWEYRTNMRACINAGIEYKDVPYGSSEEFIGFRVLAPMFSWAQLRTHGQLSSEAQSDRIIEEDRYWLPIDIEEKTGIEPKEFKRLMLDVWPQNKVQQVLKDAGYKREIYSRAPFYLKMKAFVFTAWLSDDLAWPHFMRERNAYIDKGIKNWTQPTTTEVVFAIRELIEANDGI